MNMNVIVLIKLNEHIAMLPITDYENVQTMPVLLFINIQLNDAVMIGLYLLYNDV